MHLGILMPQSSRSRLYFGDKLLILCVALWRHQCPVDKFVVNEITLNNLIGMAFICLLKHPQKTAFLAFLVVSSKHTEIL